ncbi:hypothetical protein ZWY2020_057265 [Hordeum vulgare]|nr:hypothetical protein ZWY2020_057265 [Hordeum vulgare]
MWSGWGHWPLPLPMARCGLSSGAGIAAAGAEGHQLPRRARRSSSASDGELCQRHGRPHPLGLGAKAAPAANPAGMSASKRTTSSSTTATTGKLSTVSTSTFMASTVSGGSTDDGYVEDGHILESPNLRIFTFAELRSACKNFKPETVLGEGGFGKVYKGWIDVNPAKGSTAMVVAVKKLNPESVQGMEQWQSEVNFLGRISHPNLVRLLGYCMEDNELLLVYEFMAKGSLENHLFRRGAIYEPLPWSLRLKILIGAARGLAFLHSSEKQIIYRDFKAQYPIRFSLYY